MESNIDNLKAKRIELVDGGLKSIGGWDKSYEAGIEIIDGVEDSLGEIQRINNLLEDSHSSMDFDEIYQEKISQLKDEYRAFLDLLEIEKKKLLELIKEAGLREKVKNNYIQKDSESMFIDKDL